MKLRLLILALVGAVASSRAQPAFDGYMIFSGRPSFVVSSQDKKSGWLTLGRTFDGYLVVDFDPHAEVLVVEKDGSRKNLPLRQAKIRDSSSADRKARLRSLTGMELAYEFAKDGDELITGLLKRYQEVLFGIGRGQVPESSSEFMRKHIEKAAADRLALVLADK